MKKQIDGQINLFDYISSEDKYNIENMDQILSDLNILKSENSDTISFFQECIACWCSTCRHNAKGRAVSRDFAGEEKPCPSCDFCISGQKAEICEIGSYENGCKLRAEEEGIV